MSATPCPMLLKPLVLMFAAGSMVLSAAAATSHAQVIRGIVADSATAKPVDSSRVSLIGSDGQVVGRVLTDRNGQFALSARAPGSHLLLIERAGYRTVRTERFDSEAGAVITLSLFLPPLAVGLEAVTVTAEAAALYLQRSGYAERKRTGQGVYLDGSELEERRKGARELSDMLRAISGVSTMAIGGSPSAVKLRGMESASRPCRMPLMYLDGLLVSASDSETSWGRLVRELNTVVLPDHILAIEVYRGSSTLPSEYSGADSGCGVILIWTIHSNR